MQSPNGTTSYDPPLQTTFRNHDPTNATTGQHQAPSQEELPAAVQACRFREKRPGAHSQPTTREPRYRSKPAASQNTRREFTTKARIPTTGTAHQDLTRTTSIWATLAVSSPTRTTRSPSRCWSN